MSCENNKSIVCTCTYSCGRHGKCCECVKYHLDFGQFPACFFTEKMEKTYDRGFDALLKDREKA